jgi:hypothetical protein
MDRRNQVVIAVAMLCGAAPVAADTPPLTGTARFVGRYWSQSRPALNYQYGCDTGWHSFSFSAQGFFLYDRRISGHWWLDHASNVGVLTNEGERLTLIFDGSSTLVQWRRDEDASKSPFGQEYRTYRECAAGAGGK